MPSTASNGSETCIGSRPNCAAVDPQAYLTNTLTAIINGHKQSQIEALLPWNGKTPLNASATPNLHRFTWTTVSSASP
ncbi:transposase domain-containing protein [Rhizobium sp. N324]|uniref:transposase domain-containing protein n=1 Tax=Rhizobium sp. N324 TaxID=1703969 RepID=UPI0009EE495A